MALVLYREYQLSFRDPAQLPTITAEWTAKSVAQRKEWRNHYLHTQDLQEHVEATANQVDLRRTAYDNFIIRDEESFRGFRNFNAELQHRCADLANRYRNLANAWLQLQAIETAQGNYHLASLANAVTEATNWNGYVDERREQVYYYQQHAIDYPIELDSQQRKRMPVRWLRELRSMMRFRRKVGEDIAAAELGFDPGELMDDDQNDGGEDVERLIADGRDGKVGVVPDEWEVEGVEVYFDDEFEGVDGALDDQCEPVDNEEIVEEQPPPAEELPAERWVPQAKYAGGQSIGCLWLKLDREDKILDRLFRKDTHRGENSWLHPLCWESNVLDLNSRWPLEMAVTDALAQIPNLKHTVRLRARPDPRHIDDDLFAYRMYLACARYGDLHSLIKRHINIDHPADTTPVPEPFVWYVAEALARVGVALREGAGGPPGNVVWREIIHRDLKPSNVFLDMPLDDNYKFYPRPVLGEYGMVITTQENDPLNPRFYFNWGTPGFYPPEQLEQVDYNDLTAIEDFPLSEKTNVYGVGLILWCLINKTTKPRDPSWIGDPKDDRTLAINDPNGDFSYQLKDIITLCLQYDPRDRPTFDHLLDWIEESMSGKRDLSDGMMAGDADNAAQARNMPRLEADICRRGMARPEPRL